MAIVATPVAMAAALHMAALMDTWAEVVLLTAAAITLPLVVESAAADSAVAVSTAVEAAVSMVVVADTVKS